MTAVQKKTPSPSEVRRNPELFARHFLKIQDKAMRTTPLVYNPLQRRYLAERTPRDLILKPRQIGFTTCIQAEFRRYEWTRPSSTMTLTKDYNSTQRIRLMADFFYDNLPQDFRPVRKYSNAALATYPALNSRAVIATAGSEDVGRSDTFSRLHGSEVAFWPDAQKIMVGAMQAGSPDWITLESTANGAQGYFYELCMTSLDGGGVFKLHFYTWFDYAAYRTPLEPGEVIQYTDDEGVLVEKHGLSPEQIKWRRLKIAEIGNLDDFLQEYPEDPYTCFKKSGQSYFGVIDYAFNAPFNAEYNPQHRYYAGLDFGQQQDYTALSIGDVVTLQQVDLLHVRRERWEDMRLQIRDKCKKWNVGLLYAEKNSIGSVNIEAMYREFAEGGLSCGIVPFDMTHASKPRIMSALRMGIHEGGFRMLPIPVQKHEFSATVTKETMRGWTVDTPRDKQKEGDVQGHGDTVVANALLWHAISMGGGVISGVK